jgi:hypothetical protein
MNIHQILDDLKAVFSRLDGAIAALEGSNVSSRRPKRGRPPKSPSSRPATGERTMSPAARKRIGAAKKAWWAKQKGKGAPKQAAAPAKKATVRKPMSPAMKKKMSALMKARWAATKKAGAKTL